MLGILLVSAVCCVFYLCYRRRKKSPRWQKLLTIQDMEQGKNNGGECSKGGRADCVGLGAWAEELYRPCDLPVLRPLGEYCSIKVQSSPLWLWIVLMS